MKDATRENGRRPVEADPNPVSERGGYEETSYRDEYDPMLPHLSEEAFLRMETNRASICREERESWFRRRFGHVSPALKQLAGEVEGSGAEMLVLIIPDSFQVEEDLFAAILGETGSRREDYELDRPQRALRDFFDANGIEYVDALEPFRKAAKSRKLYRLGDTHWNPEGNRLAADLLLEQLAPRRSSNGWPAPR